jgi:5'-nucleotidase
MLVNRRSFLRQASLAGAGLVVSSDAVLAGEVKKRKLTILHTNDVHSRLDAFTDGSLKGKGGVAARSKLIRQIREQEEQVLLLDAGDMFQGTPYFNVYKGEPEIRAMSMMGYDAGMIGNHEFDAGIENLANQISRHATFPVVICNYDFSGTPMEHVHKPYHIIRKGDIRVGITGLGIEMKGLVADGLYGTTVYLDPVEQADKMAAFLRKEKKCDLVIVLSHLGDRYQNDKISDEILAQRTSNIDLIIGAHTHRFFEKPRVYRNAAGEQVLVNQVGWGGIQLGRIDYEFTSNNKKTTTHFHVPVE